MGESRRHPGASSEKALTRRESKAGLLAGALRRELVARWRSRIRRAPRRPPPLSPANEVRATGGRPRVLVVAPIYPYPPIHGGAVRVYELLRRLGETCDIHLLIVGGGTDDPLQRRELGQFCRGVYFHLRTQPGEISTMPDAPVAARPFLAPRLGERIRSLVSAHDIEIVQLEFTELAGLAGFAHPAKVVVVEYDIAFRSYRRRLLASKTLGEPADGLEWLRWHRYELSNLRWVDQVQVMSEADGRFLAARLDDGAARVRVVPNGANLSPLVPPLRDGVPGARPPKTLLFLGSFPHAPNPEALRYFVDSIWPRLRAADPQIRLLVCGSRPPEWVTALDGIDGIEVAGEVVDLAPIFARATMMVVPLLSGSGTRLKILEAMACGLPVVSTRLGAEGLELSDGQHLLLADGAKPFADATLRLLRDSGLRERLAGEAAARIAAEYDWNRIAELNLAAWQELGAGAKVGVGRRLSAEIGLEASDAPTGLVAEIVVPLIDDRRPSSAFLDALAAQDFHLPFASSLVSSSAPAAQLAADLARRGLCYRRLDVGGPGAGELLDAAVATSPAEIVAVLDPCDVPTSPYWLANLSWAHLQPSPPAAVVGEVLQGAREPSSRDVATEWGFPLRNSNFAVRRSVQEEFPFGPGGHAIATWREQLGRGRRFVFSSPDAPVRRSEAHRGSWGRLATEFAATVVICTRERGASLEATVRSLVRQEAPFDWEIVIVDNGSQDGSLELARSLERELEARVRVAEESTVGLSAARNRGILLARSEHVLFLDDDALPADGWLAALVAALGEPGVFAAGGPIDPLFSGERPGWLDDRYLPYLSAWDRGGEAHDLFYNELPRGTNMAFRRAAFERFGLFSRHLGRRGRSLLSCEETELGLRIERGGGRIRYAPAARVQHRVETARLKPEFLVARFAAQGRSEAIVDWMHGGLSGLRRGLAAEQARVHQAAAESGAGAKLYQSCQRASAAGYRREILRAMLWIPRL
ncbi:MAG: glycosyltransferase [Thermoanaerobaculia bacterium]